MCCHFFYTVQVGNIYQKLMLASVFKSWNSENKRTYSAQVRLHCHLLKKNFLSNELVWFYSLYRNCFLRKNMIFLYKLKIFFAILHLKIFLEYWIILYVYLQNIVACNESLNRNGVSYRSWVFNELPMQGLR